MFWRSLLILHGERYSWSESAWSDVPLCQLTWLVSYNSYNSSCHGGSALSNWLKILMLDPFEILISFNRKHILQNSINLKKYIKQFFFQNLVFVHTFFLSKKISKPYVLPWFCIHNLLFLTVPATKMCYFQYIPIHLIVAKFQAD